MTKSIVIIIIYIVGCLVAFIMFRHDAKQKDKKRGKEDAQTWLEIRLAMWFSLLSWIAIVVFLFCSFKFPKPPKWL